MTEDLVKEILKYVRVNSENRDLSISALRLIKNCVNNKDKVDFVTNNKGVETVFLVLNAHPTDKDILELSGEILAECSALEKAKELKKKYPEFAKDFNPENTEGLEKIKQTNIHLGNLLTTIPEEEDEE